MKNVYNCIGHDLHINNIVSSNDCFLYDNNDKEYVDLESGVWCTSVGHNNKCVNRAIKNQIDSITHTGYCYSNEIVQTASEEILSIVDFQDGKCVFLCSGSEAIELSRQISKHLTKKPRSMTLHDSYLGSYSSVKNRDTGWFIFDWKECVNCRNNKNCSMDCKYLKEIPDDISDFIFEPGSSSGFVRFPPESLIQNIVKIVRSNGGKIISNEVTTGIGRTGKWFGYNHYLIEPDIIAIGKGIGNGYPVSVTAINKNTINELEMKPFIYSQSHQNDPLGCVVVNEVIKIIKEEDLVSKAESKGKKFLSYLKSLQDNKTITDVRGRGLMFVVDICSVEVAGILFEKLIEKGYIVCNRGNLFRIDPALTIKEELFSNFISDFHKILCEINTASNSD